MEPRSLPLVPATIALSAVVAFAFIGVVATKAWDDYRVATASAESRTRTLVDLVGEQLESAVITTDLVLHRFAQHIEEDLSQTLESGHGLGHDTHLMYMAGKLPNDPWLVALDASGTPFFHLYAREAEISAGDHGPAESAHPRPDAQAGVSQSDPPAHEKILSADDHTLQAPLEPEHPGTAGAAVPPDDAAAYRAYVAFHKQDARDGVWLGPPLMSGHRSQWFVGLSRRISTADGRFAGVVLVLLKPDFLEVLARSLDLGEGGGLGLLGADGSPMMWLATEGGTSRLVHAGQRRAVAVSPSGTAATGRITEDAGSDAYILSHRPLVTVPGMHAAVAVDRATVRGKWLGRRIEDGALVVAFGLVFALLAIPASRLIVTPIREVERAISHLRQGDFSQPTKQVYGIREIAGVAAGIEAARVSLKELTGELETRRQQAEVANRAKSEFLTNMSHELKTPLNAIIGFSQLMRDEQAGPLDVDKTKEYLGDIYDSGSHLLEIINDILDVSKIEIGKFALDPVRLDLAQVVEATIRIVRPRADAARVVLFTNLAEDLPRVPADQRALKQVLLNLISNAVKFNRPGGRVTVSAEAAGDNVLIRVTDTGVGIPAEKIADVLAPFCQVDGGIDRRHEGMGLGLYLSKSLVELHGGTLALDSEVGVGTTVSVSLPRNQGDRLVA